MSSHKTNYAKRNKLIRELVKNTGEEFSDEELMHLLLEQKVTADIDVEEKGTFGQRAADAVAKFAGSWAFIGSFMAILIIWMVVNVLLASRAFDAYPFILLNLVLSCVAAVQAPLIMMSQNRQGDKDRKRGENDYKVNLKTELVTNDLHYKLDEVIENQKRILKALEKTKKGSTDEPARSHK